MIISGAAALVSAKADPMDDYFMTHMFGEPSEGFVAQTVDTLNEGAKVAGEIRGWVIRTNNEIAATRQAFWAEYPSGSNLRETADQLARLLFEKDLYYLMGALDGPHTRLVRMVGGQLDGGIADSAYYEFSEWQGVFAERLEANGRLNSVFDFPVAITKSFMEAMPSVEPYQVARNWAEFQNAPVQIPTRQYVFMLVQRFPRPAPDNIARQDFDLLIKTFSENRVLEVAKRIQDAPKKAGFLDNPADLGIFRAQGIQTGREKVREDMIVVRDAKNPYTALWALLTKDDPKLYLLNVIFDDHIQRAGLLPATVAREGLLSLGAILDEWNGLIKQYGAGKVAEAAEKVRKAPKTTNDGSLFIPKDVGVSAFELYPAVLELLTGKRQAVASATLPTPTPSPLRWDTWEMPSYHIASHRQDRNILVYFSSDQSPLCDRMNKKVLDTSRSFLDFARPNLYPVKLNLIKDRELDTLDKIEETQRVQLMKQFNITGYPTFVLLNKTGEEISRCVGFTEETPFVKWLTEANSQTKFPAPPPGPMEPAVPAVSTASSSSAPAPLPTVALSSTPAPIPTPPSRFTPAPSPIPTATPYPESADLWKAREQAVRQEYDRAWMSLSEATRSRLRDDEARFQDTLKAFDPATRIRALRHRLEFINAQSRIR